ncbi:efflux system, outer membrane component [Campylobacter sp. RM16704]|uniref:efflux system, outer membrane component n=1 Tax=Campylobacter sp. RM16704 TaxID=1500960 RepID=UPI00057EC779|nr:efflux system, outer membrane component [Campylobacter sp. RM16704]AJC86432.1 type I secretion system, outer membrane protein, TolC family [Campylobacter sp. RM16704]
MKILYLLFLPLFLLANNLKEFIDLSLNNENYLQKQLQFSKSILEQESVQNAYLPSLHLGVSYLGSNKDRFIIEPQESLMSTLSLKFLLFDGGNREAKIASMQSLKQLAHLEKENMANYMALSASVLYFNYLSLESIIASDKQKEITLQNQLKRLENFYQAGLTSQSELESIRAKFELSSYELAQNELKLYELKNEIYNLSKTHFIPSFQNILQEPSVEKNKSYEVALMQEKLNLENLKIDFVRAELFPKIFLQNSFSFYDMNYNPKLPHELKTASESFLKEHGQSNRFFVTFEWKIFDFGANQKALEAQKYTSKITQLELEKTKRKVDIELDNLLQEIEISKVKIKALNASFKAANLAFEAIEKKYIAGLCSYVEYLNALEAKYQSQSQLELAKNEYEITKARYYFTAGIDIKTKVLE